MNKLSGLYNQDRHQYAIVYSGFTKQLLLYRKKSQQNLKQLKSLLLFTFLFGVAGSHGGVEGEGNLLRVGSPLGGRQVGRRLLHRPQLGKQGFKRLNTFLCTRCLAIACCKTRKNVWLLTYIIYTIYVCPRSLDTFYVVS